MMVVPVHYKHRGVGEEKIWKVYDNGQRLLGLEVTNIGANMLQDDLGARLRKVFGKDGPGDTGGTDAHTFEPLGIGYMSCTRPKHKINDTYDVFDCIVNHDTTTNYLRIGTLRRRLISMSHYFSPVYWVKFWPWLLSKIHVKVWVGNK